MGAPWGASTYALITKEATYGTFDSVATKFTWLEIQDNNALMFDRMPQRQVKRAATGNLRRRLISHRDKFSGTFKSWLFPDQALIMLPFALSPSVINGRMNLPSFTLDWFDGSEARRFLGCRIEKFGLVSNNSQDAVESTYSIIAAKQDTVAPTMTEPAIALYPTTQVYAHTDSAGLCKLYSGSSVTLANYKSISFNVNNMLDPQFDEFSYLNTCDYCGRDVDADCVMQKINTTLKGYFEAQTNVNVYLKWAKTSPSTNSMIFDLGGSVSIEDLKTDRPLNGNQYQTLKLQSFQDLTSGTDLVSTLA